MNPNSTRLELYIDVFDKTEQRALALPELKPAQLVDAILSEFQDLEYLGDSKTGYQLLKASNQTPLNENDPLSNQVQNGERLQLAENDLPMPAGAKRPSDPIYLSEQRTGKTFKLHWVPAVVGRTSETQAHNEWVAVDLKAFPTGLRVSRRQIAISENNGQYYMENLSANPVILVRGPKESVVLDGEGKRTLEAGDIIRLARSDIALKFVVRRNGQKPMEAEAVPRG